MRVAALYDIHGNLPAVEAVLRDVEEAGAELVVMGGDVLPGPMSSACIELLGALDLPVDPLVGNGERDVLAYLEGAGLDHLPESVRPVIAWCAERLAPDVRAALGQWPATVTLDLGGVRVLFCHATPRSDREVFTRVTPEDRVAPAFEGVAADLVVCGHTHMPFERTIGGLRVVNAGSVGMPFGKPGAYWLLLDGGSVVPRHTPYDVEAAAARIRATDYPQADAFAVGNVLRPPPEATMREALERAAMGGG